MKTIPIRSILRPCFGLFIGIGLLQSCNNDDGTVQKALDEETGITLGYPDSIVRTTFKNGGNVGPNEIDWKGEKGTLSMFTSNETLTDNHIKFEEESGIIFWSRLLPLGTYDLTITAKNNKESVSTTIQLVNRFDQGYFNGGFIAGNPEEIPNSPIPSEFGIILNEDQTFGMIDFDDPTFSASGTWENLEDAAIAIEYTSNGETTYMKGQVDDQEEITLIGTYGDEKDASGEILDPKGKFLFKWD
ncbi:hypothetical protein Q4603_20745 [Zobellia galactanivorans]|uniref:hypothetical protein n=1 Tax=Zobellia galactanivorans (strain DSM 12802 / CCUG 47099 / CIP 106680 / NCIMB 13871 / Dsij) TaxID=63186 RepID=UPI0026E297E8|nr:hypothetical protein [Zobellia galactanivorans]MDO6811062.1 hypothetical protein [Zobellia galactanivorans]